MKTPIGLMCSSAVLCLASTLLFARPGTVKTTDGQTIEGDVSEQSQSVTVIRRKIPVVIQRADIESIQYPDGTVEEQFQQRLTALDGTDAAGRIALARWAFDQDQYLLARQALESALTIEPRNKEANALLDNVYFQIRLERSKDAAAVERRASTAPSTAPATTPSTTPHGPRDARHLLTLDDINTIRQLELREGDTHVRINFAKDVKKRFAQAQNRRLTEFNSLPPFEQLQEILRDGTAEMKRDVRIVSDPSSLLDYKRSVQPVVLASCATTGCHGAAGAGGLMLFNPADNEAVSYTNFFILNQHTKAAGETRGPFGAGELRLIDRVEPVRSLLLQYGLPNNIAEHDHPKVSGLRTVFRNRDDPAYRRVADWIGSSLHGITPDYGIAYTRPQRQPAATQPAQPDQPTTTRPATRPAATRVAATRPTP